MVLMFPDYAIKFAIFFYYSKLCREICNTEMFGLHILGRLFYALKTAGKYHLV